MQKIIYKQIVYLYSISKEFFDYNQVKHKVTFIVIFCEYTDRFKIQ